MNEVITIITDGQTYQTTRKTLQKSNYLTKKICENTIKLNMSSKNFDVILNYLRDNILPEDISDVENDLKVCEIIYDGNIDPKNIVNINVGGKIFNVDKEFLKSKLEYFVKFFHYNEKHDPDYTNILIDRCFNKFQKMINHLENPWKYSFTEEIKNELDYYMSNVDTEVEEFMDIDKFSYFQLGCHKYNNKSASWQLICLNSVNFIFNELNFPNDNNFYRRDNTLMSYLGSGNKYVVIQFYPDVNYKSVKSGFLDVGRLNGFIGNKIFIRNLLLKNIAVIDYENHMMGILYDPPLYNSDIGCGVELYLPLNIKIKSVKSYAFKDIDVHHDGFGFIESTISDKYTINNLNDSLIVEFNVSDIIQHNTSKYPHLFSDKFDVGVSKTDVEKNPYGIIDYDDGEYNTFIFSILDIKKRSDMIISHIELFTEDKLVGGNKLIGVSKVVQDGDNYRINKLYNDTLGLKCLLSNFDNITFKIFLIKPISGKVYINYTYHCFKPRNSFYKYYGLPSNNTNISNLMKGTSIFKTG
ncbi:hypothetical protein ma815 [Moumouvirus australiensis]|uniref:Potassium channel tetramerisation-type BTB domain-containing protein n=1 Tax=Moumouvirus australiensis TaxID=2109587 RepID=A0A2P1EMV4_9VIRU|nr:hypothetical protein QKC55_gp089 [Moumouvirus australiensis]AVL95202.1 hypothetical protein ma815 [Moumouvirus australiensis]